MQIKETIFKFPNNPKIFFSKKLLFFQTSGTFLGITWYYVLQGT
ncbi:MAG: hypothetical protein RL329_849 [Bacteroidota bacterium]|jgi:hypothetical protein